MESKNLICHPATPCSNVRQINVDVCIDWNNNVAIQYSLKGDLGKLQIPAKRAPARTNDLWQHTCFEAFIAMSNGENYIECNFAPSGEWAIDEFDSYRAGMKEIEAKPIVNTRLGNDHLVVEVKFVTSFISRITSAVELRVGLSAVIEDHTGALSYWALAHPAGKPDFHHRDNFALTLNPLKNSL